MTMGRYSLHGVTIDSEIPLGSPVRADSRDLTLTRSTVDGPLGDEPPEGEPLAALSGKDQRLYSAAATDGGYVLRIHGVCDFMVDASLGTVECRALPSADEELLSLLVRGALLAFVLGLGGSCVLHASAVETDEGSVVFVGISGMGKSTMAGLACRDGARFICDDLLRLGPGDPPGWVGCSSELRLRPAAAALVPSDVQQAWGARRTVDDRVAVKPPGPSRQAGTIGAVVLPAPTRSQPRLELTRIEPFEAAFVLSTFPRLQWVYQEALAAQFDGVTRLAESVPLYRASVPWGPPFEDGLGERVVKTALQRG